VTHVAKTENKMTNLKAKIKPDSSCVNVCSFGGFFKQDFAPENWVFQLRVLAFHIKTQCLSTFFSVI